MCGTYIYNGIFLSHQKEQIWVHCSEVDEPRACYTEWSKSEREKQIQDINAYIWNLEKWYWWTYFQGRNGDTDVVNGPVDSAGQGEAGWTEKVSLTYNTACVHAVAQLCPTLCDPMDRNPPGCSVHGILQARILDWVAIPSSQGIFQNQGSDSQV